MNGIAALLEQGRYLAAQTDAFPSTTETVEALNHAQEGIEEVAKNPGIIRTWLEGLVPDLLNFAFQILIALLVYVIGGRLIKWITKLVRRSMDRAGTDEGVKQFMIPVIKYSLYVVLIFYHYGIVWNCDDISGGGAWIGGCGGRSGVAGKPVEFCGRRADFAVKAVQGRGLHH